MHPFPQYMGSNLEYRMYTFSCTFTPCADPEGGGGLKTHKNIEFLSKTGPDPSENHKATKPAFNVGHYWPTSKMPFQWRFSGRRIIARFCEYWSLPPLKNNNTT